MKHTDFYNGKKVLVTGGTGTIGSVIVRRLSELGAHVTVASIDTLERARQVLGDTARFVQTDLRIYENCLEAATGMDHVIHLMAVKGNTQIGLSKVASAFVPMLQCNTNMMEAAFRCGVMRYLYVGSICEYPGLDIRHEDDMWSGPPQANDRYTGICKRTGEAQAEAYLHEHGWDAVRIVRPSNVYGPFDDFDPRTAQVIPALIARMAGGENPVKIAGDGSAVRDFIFSEDVGEGMLLALEHAPACLPINMGSGARTTVRMVAEAIAECMPIKPEIQWDITKPTGDQVRVLAMERAKAVLRFEARTPLLEGIQKTLDWYLAHRDIADKRGRELHG